MGQGFVFKGKVLCEECYGKAEDYEIHAGREVPPKKLVEGQNCQNCDVELTDISGG
jgi:hypothetical protein